MNRHEEIEWIIRMVADGADDIFLRECIGKALDKTYQEGYRQSQEDMNEAVAFTSTERAPIDGKNEN